MDFEAPHLWVEYFLEELSLSNAEFHLSHCLFKSSRWRRGCLRKWQFVISFPSEQELGTKWRQGKKQTGTGRWVGDMAGFAAALQWDARMENPEGSSWGREGRCSCEQQHGKAPRGRTEGRLEKGQKLDATLDFQICTSLNTHTHGHPHTLLLPKLLPKSCASMDYPKRVHLICSQREEFSKFPSIFHRNETETSLESCSESENKLSFCPSSPTKEKHIMVTSWSSLWFLTKKTSKSVKWLSISWQPCKLWTPVLTGNSY